MYSLKNLIQCLAGLAIINIAIAATILLTKLLFGTPGLQLDKSVVDFGVMPNNVAMTKSVNVKNVGTSNLNVLRLHMGCGCTAAKLFPDGPIAPGKSARIEVTLKLEQNSTQGQKVVTVYVVSNDPDQPVAKIIAKGKSGESEIAVPGHLDFGRVENLDRLPMRREVVLRNLHGVADDLQTYVIHGPEEDEYITVEPIDSTGGNNRFSVALTAGAPSGDFCVDLSYQELSSGLGGKIRVRGHIPGEFLSLPQMVVLGPILPNDTPISKTVQIIPRNSENHDELNGPIAISDVSVSKDLIKLVSISTANSERGLDLTITMNPRNVSGVWSDRSILGRVTLQLSKDKGRIERLNIPVSISTHIQRLRDSSYANK